VRGASTRTTLVTSLVLAGSLVFVRCAPPAKPGGPLPGLTLEQRRLFEEGRQQVQRAFTQETGGGPLFNAPACGECHEDPVAGGAGDEVEIHVSVVRDDGTCDPLVERGGPVIQQLVTPLLHAALGIDREPMPAEATVQAGRKTPPLFGLGLLDAVPESTILSYADPEDRNGDGISGRPNRFFDGRLGRFGHKGLIPSLREFNDGATVVEQGVTNPAVPTEESIGGDLIPPGTDPVPEPEIDRKAIDAIDAFVRFLAPPAPRKVTWAARRGRSLFSSIGCAACHVPTLTTGDSTLKALRHVQVAAYTDLLLHDLGPELSDICFGLASPAEFRTQPLMGLGLGSQFMHDGRAGTIEQAVLLHAGEAASSRDRFKALSKSDQAALLRFLESL
jgi:CxxC motif-containing protein (DUF1111 family)